jgi:hypothetical protein
MIPLTAHATEEITFQIKDRDTPEAVAVRCLIRDSQGNSIKPSENANNPIPGTDHFYAEGPFKIQVDLGVPYHIFLDRGLAWLPTETVFSVTETSKTANITMGRYVNLQYNRWHSGDLDLRVAPSKAPLILGSADLNVACQVVPASEVALAASRGERGVFHYPGSRAHTGRDWDLGDYHLLAALPQMSLDETPFNASQLPILKKGKDQAGIIEVVNLAGEEVPVAIALGWVDLVRGAGSGGGRTQWNASLPEEQSGNWTEERVLARFTEYYHYLNCGVHLPLSAGSQATEKTLSPLDRAGAARLYVRLPGSFSFGNFMNAANAGRSWVTAGPLISLGVNGKDPGEMHRVQSGSRIKISVGARSPRPLSRVEVIYNGEVISALPVSATADFTIKDFEIAANEGGWLAARAFEKSTTEGNTQDNILCRYAHTSPAYIVVDGKRPVDKSQAQKFAAGIEVRLQALKSESSTPDKVTAQVLEWYTQALAFYTKLLE